MRKYKFLGMYGETPDITGGMGGEGVDAFAKFLDAGGTLVTMGNAVRFPTELGFARTVDASGTTSSDFYAPRPLVNAEVLKLDHPVFYGYTDKIMPIKYLGGPLMSVGAPDQAGVLARYVGGDEAVLSGLMKGASEIRQRPFAIDVPGGFTGKGRVVLFSNNPIYRWQNHGEFNMVFNTHAELERPGRRDRSARDADRGTAVAAWFAGKIETGDQEIRSRSVSRMGLLISWIFGEEFRRDEVSLFRGGCHGIDLCRLLQAAPRVRTGVARSRPRSPSTAARRGLVTARESIVMRTADGTIVEVFEWVSQEAIAGAHGNPAVQDLWKRFEAVCSYETPANLAEFQNMFGHFEAL